ncbi:MAG: UDP-2,3-diacylglucosamine diphosphatase [Burkholderiales bacterium]|nr:UDP-2,3-diacylglucosamine diphosphatase [Burkholderiales bacterium]
MREPGGLPVQAWQAPPQWQSIDLLSDVHLHPGMPRTFDAWRTHMRDTPADAVVILGDLFEVWVGDDACHEPFEQACCDVLRAASAHRMVAFMPGNRDFLVGDGMLRDCGVHRLSDPTRLEAWNKSWLLTHGDALCLADLDYQRFRREVRSPEWQQRFLSMPLSMRQQQARAMRDASAAHQANQGPSNWADVDLPAASAWLIAAEADAMVHGHTHRPGASALPCGRIRQVLSDWDLDGSHARADVLRLTPAGCHRIDLVAP